MIPEIITPFGNIPTFPCFVVLGVLSFLLILHISLRKAYNREKEEEFILIKLVIAGFCAWFFSGLFDSIFKYFEYGTFEWRGITFYGGLFGFLFSLPLLLRKTKEKQKTQFSIREWIELSVLPLISFHFFGRLGCFFAGCCYGKTTTSIIGVMFEGSLKRYPTQLFEVGLLLVIFIAVLFVKQRFAIYLLCYSTGRFIIEFFRGDDRGYLFRFLSPAQVISIFVFAFALILLRKRKDNCLSRTDDPQ